MYGCGVIVVVILSPKEEERKLFSEVSHMTVNHHYLCHPYYHDGWYFDLIHMVLHNFQPRRHQKHCCIGFV